MHNADLLPANLLGLLESKSQDALGCFSRDKFDALHDSIDNNVLDS